MSFYNNSAFGPSPVLMVGGNPVFLFGGFNDRVPNTSFQITEVAIASNVATITGYVTSGNLPAVGSLISVQGTQTDSGAANVSAVAITAVSISASTGEGTISYAATGANQSATADAGLAIVKTPLTYDTLANGSSVPAASAENDPSVDDERSYFAQVWFSTIPTACTVSLQASLTNSDADFQTVGTVATVSGGTVSQSAATFSNMNYRFIRFNVSGLFGLGTIAAALLG